MKKQVLLLLGAALLGTQLQAAPEASDPFARIGQAVGVTGDTQVQRQRFLQALGALRQRLEAIAPGQPLPDNADPDILAVMQGSSLIRPLLGEGPVRAEDAAGLREVCQASTAMAGQLRNVGVDPAEKPLVRGIQSRRNSLRYQTEISRLLAFSNRCYARLLPAAGSPQPAGTARMDVWHASGQTFIDVLDLITDAGYGEASKRNLLEAMTATMPAYTASMPLDLRRLLRQRLQNDRAYVPAPLQGGIEQLLQSLASTHCQGYCQPEGTAAPATPVALPAEIQP